MNSGPLCSDNLISPFLDLSFGMVSSYLFDYMHLVCLGVVRRMIYQWVHGSKKNQSLSKTSLPILSEKKNLNSMYQKNFHANLAQYGNLNTGKLLNYVSICYTLVR